MKHIITTGLIAGAMMLVPVAAFAGHCGMSEKGKHYKQGYSQAHPHHHGYKKSYGKHGHGKYYKHGYSKHGYGKHGYKKHGYGKHAYNKYGHGKHGYNKHGHGHPHAYWQHPMCKKAMKAHRMHKKHGHGHGHGHGHPGGYWKHPMCGKMYGDHPVSYKQAYKQGAYQSDNQQTDKAAEAENQASESTQVSYQANQDAAKANLFDTAAAAGQFNTLVGAIEAADLVATLEGPGPFTVFAPTDEAFAKIPENILNALVNDKQALTDLLTLHVVPGKVSAEEAAKLDSAKTAQGSSLTIDASDGIKVNNARVVTADIEASNGIIHVVDSVVLPN